MIAEAGTGAAHEILVVLAVALAGLLLALLAAFSPWYDKSAEADRVVVVEPPAPAALVVDTSVAAFVR